MQPDLLLCRTSQSLDEAFRQKIALLCGIGENYIFEGLDTKCVDEIPLNFERQGMGHLVLKRLGLEARPTMDAEWVAMVEKLKNPKRKANVAIVGKYTTGSDAYISVQEALKHGGIANETAVDIEWIEAESLTEHLESHKSQSALDSVFQNADGILVPGGFGYRGIEGMLVAARYARENKIPYLGLCLGMQCLVIEFARHVAKLKNANSTEVDEETPYPVIDLMHDQRAVADLGATMRLGHYPCVLKEDTKSYAAYQQPIIVERHRHRYELNNQYRSQLEASGALF